MTKNILKFFSLPRSVLLIILIAFTLRVASLSENLFFGYEQGRDLLAIKDIIVNKNLTLLGPKTDADGIFHGPLSYYLLIPSFLLTGGNPLLITISLIFVHIVSFYFLYKTVKELFGEKTAVLTILFSAISYSSIVYSRWLSNPNLIPALVIGIFCSLVRAREKPIFLVLAAAFFAITFHLSLISAATLVAPILLTIFVLKVKLSMKNVVLSILACALLLSSYPVFELRNDFLITNGVKHLWETGDNKALSLRNIEQFKNEVVDGVFPMSRTVALYLFVFAIGTTLWKSLKNKNYLLPAAFTLFPPLMFLLSGISPVRHVYIGVPAFISLILAITVGFLLEKKKRFLSNTLIAVLVVGNIWTYGEFIPRSSNNFLQRSQRTYLGPELKMIDFAYKDANGEAFNYEYYSIPYWKEEGWKYLTEWYGKNKYGYVPQYKNTKIFYVFMEPDEHQELYQKNWYETMDAKSNLIEQKTFDKLTVEKRERL